MRSQRRLAQTAKWEHIIGLNKILDGGDWNAHSDRWDPRCRPRRDYDFVETVMDEQVLINDTDQEPTDTCMRNSEIMESRIDCFVIKDTKPE